MNTQTATKTKVEVYDPAMCCSTGVCGPDVDDALVDFANDVKWMKTQGVEVQRYNIGQEPEAFKMSVPVVTRLQKDGTDCLPIILVDGDVVSEGGYPSRKQLMGMLGLEEQAAQPSADSTTDILSVLEQAAVNGDEEAMRNQFRLGEQQGVEIQKLVTAIQNGIDSRQLTTQKMVQAANDLLGVSPSGNSCAPGSGCC